MAYILSTQAYAIIMLHGAKYPSEAVSGVLLGSKQERKITRAVPLVHSILLPSPPVQIALEQIEVYAKQKKLEIVGLYFGNQVNVDVLIHPATELIANKIEENVGGGSVIVRVFLIDEINPASITSDRLGLVYYCYENKIWKETMAIKVEGAQLIPSKLEKWIHDRIFENLNDFDDHLNNVSLDWLENVGLVI